MAFVNYTENRSLSKSVGRISPYEELYQEIPDVSKLHIFGCRASVLFENKGRSKFAPKSRRCIYLGPNLNGMGDKFFEPHMSRIIISRNAIFFENLFKNIDSPTLAEFLPSSSKKKDDDAHTHFYVLAPAPTQIQVADAAGAQGAPAIVDPVVPPDVEEVVVPPAPNTVKAEDVSPSSSSGGCGTSPTAIDGQAGTWSATQAY